MESADRFSELYTDESPGLKVDPVIVLVLSLGFIFSVVALHSESTPRLVLLGMKLTTYSHCKGHPKVQLVGAG